MQTPRITPRKKQLKENREFSRKEPLEVRETFYPQQHKSTPSTTCFLQRLTATEIHFLKQFVKEHNTTNDYSTNNSSNEESSNREIAFIIVIGLICALYSYMLSYCYIIKNSREDAIRL